ncbi:hypothetical protein [Carboxylicivirga taeanensis]|uniref:DUF7946 domain-containing protein n=1 Tax=Carboxylicivirga taeanensis TaxID=1416875 RepID=UPI003F6E2E34
MIEKELTFDIRYTGGDAEQNKLSLYDASTSILGLAKALNITAHTLVTKGDVRVKGASVPDVKTFLHPPKKGSFIETVSVVFGDPAVVAIGGSVIASAFYAMLEYSWKIATGQDVQPTNPTVKKIIEKNDLIDLALCDVLEKPLQQMHRPITRDSDMKIQVRRPRVGKVIQFDFNTKEFVSSINEVGRRSGIKGNVTKYNIITGYGRIYVDELNRTIPFNIDRKELTLLQESIIKWSLYQSSANDYEVSKILITARVINDKQNQVKRYTIVKASKFESNEANEEVV